MTESDCNAARANLTSFRLVGTTERYSRFAAKFCELYGLKNFDQTGRFNQSEDGALFDSNDGHVRLKLRPLVKYDLELYDYVVRHRLDELPAPEDLKI